MGWQKQLCAHRNLLRGAAFGRSLDEGATFYIFLLALQTPQEAWFIRAVRNTVAVRYFAREGPAWHRHRLVVDWEILSHDQLPFGDDDDLFVLSNLSFTADGVACGGALEENLLQWKEQWPLPLRASASSVRAAAGALAPVLVMHPWIAEYLKNDKPSAGAAPARPSGDGLAPSDDLDIDDVLAAAWFELDTRLNDAPAASVSSNDFFIRVRGSTVGAEANKGLPRLFCAQYSLRVATSFAMSMYSDDICFAMASEWCRRMGFFYSLWIEANDHSYIFTNNQLNSYEPDPFWVDMRDLMLAGSLVRARADAIDGVEPR